MRRRFFFALLVLLVPVAVPASQEASPGLRISVEPAAVPVGGTFRLVLAYDLPEGARIGQPPEVRGIESLSVVKRETAQGRIVLTVLADSLDPVRIGPLELGYANKDGQKAFLRSGVVTVGVASNLKDRDPGDPKPIRDIIPTSRPWVGLLATAGFVLLACAAIAGIVYAWKRRTEPGRAAGPPEAPHLRAEREIEALLQDNLFEQGRQKEFYFRFTGIVKRYLGSVRGFPALECTTEEIAGRSTGQDMPVLSILRYADRVKFADEVAPARRKEDDVSAFLAYVDVTAPRAAEETPGQEGKP
jgi:hypothetical protein